MRKVKNFKVRRNRIHLNPDVKDMFLRILENDVVQPPKVHRKPAASECRSLTKEEISEIYGGK